LLAIPAIFMGFANSAFAQADQLPYPIGGQGGAQFFARCPIGQMLNGVELRTGDDVDAIRPICATAYSLTSIGPRTTPYSSFFGGDGGAPKTLTCPDNAPLVTKIYVDYEGEKTLVVNSFELYCTEVAPTRAPPGFPQAKFDGPTNQSRLHQAMQTCPDGLVAVGINGRSGIWLDAVGLTCGAAQITPQGKTLGRVNRTSPPRPPMSLCDAAADARRRKSPATPNLEAQCEASKKAAAAAAAAAAVPPPPPPVAAITTADLESLRARGELLSNSDALAKELRNRTTAGDVRRGFDIGMGVWAGNTAPGPGKQRVHDALSPLEQPGFDIAAAFSLPRNKNAVFANVGAAIASADPVVAKARAAENDVFYWLGFDIASGIFGNPTAGAQGNTAVGPGSLGIRDEMNAPGQRGFNAAVALHLGRKYR
jgi:hypothetical protein